MARNRSGRTERFGESVARRVPAQPREPKKTFVLYTEGEVTEPDYFQTFGRVRGATVRVECKHRGSAPISVVNAAIEFKESAEFDSSEHVVAAVFDVDEHKLQPALKKAKEKGVPCYVSDPCFELWLLLHFEEQTAAIHRAKVLSALRRNLRGYDKHVTDKHFAELSAGFSSARSRAKTTCRNAPEGEFGTMARTNVHELVDQIVLAIGKFLGPEGELCCDSPEVKMALGTMLSVVIPKEQKVASRSDGQRTRKASRR